MAALSEEVEPSTLGVYAQQLQRCLQWDPVNGAEGQNKQVFVEALTEIAALPLDSISMEIRRLLVVSNAVANTQPAQDPERDHIVEIQSQHVHLRNIIAALSARDVQLKCKAANAVGSLCISRVAGQQLLGIYGEQILKSVSKMATRKNQWVQGDAFFVLGWMVVIADEETLTAIAELLPTVIKHLHRNVNLSIEIEGENDGEMASRRSKAALASSEQASNFRVYALVLLLNFSQRHVDVFAEQLEQALPMLKDLILKLLEPLPAAFEDESEPGIRTTFFDLSEFAEVLRLTITLLSVLVDQLEGTASRLLDLKVLPSLLKLKRVLETSEACELVGDTGIQEITERLDAVIETLLNCR
ncbi:hypothetical protein GN244_ATG16014 [Phytophthora infestans]|uniref:Uncharacterized protein n=1 Tax=Phytophthora infestans TaxID=4787 RepID=A0A833WN46_PHYIN|nr:hypothetical protein GN244_ATG16014 [Phytophthora infestans]KAF4150363.1 hypothetical protein GN958_ATG00420 [Phytophthora infestans]